MKIYVGSNEAERLLWEIRNRKQVMEADVAKLRVGLLGIVRRTLYSNTNIYIPYMAGAMFFGTLLALGFLAFLINLIRTYGLRTLIKLFIPQAKT